MAGRKKKKIAKFYLFCNLTIENEISDILEFSRFFVYDIDFYFNRLFFFFFFKANITGVYRNFSKIYKRTQFGI